MPRCAWASGLVGRFTLSRCYPLSIFHIDSHIDVHISHMRVGRSISSLWPAPTAAFRLLPQLLAILFYPLDNSLFTSILAFACVLSNAVSTRCFVADLPSRQGSPRDLLNRVSSYRCALHGRGALVESLAVHTFHQVALAPHALSHTQTDCAQAHIAAGDSGGAPSASRRCPPERPAYPRVSTHGRFTPARVGLLR